MCNKKAMHSVLAAVVIVIAIAVALVVSVWNKEGMTYIIFVSRFFDVMIPILGVGALIKYLLSGCHCPCCKHDDTQK
jgi:hypothetical protein